ncbi:MAG: phospho-sugar mutase, partial [Pirellulales bacterium]
EHGTRKHGSAMLSPEDSLERLKTAQRDGKLTADAVTNIRAWLTQPRYGQYVPQVIEHIDAEQWQQLDDVFWTVIPFGTGGRRGRMYPIGSNAINDRTIGESAQGLADYVLDQVAGERSLACAIAYDTRHQSDHFARLCTEIMVAAGFTVYFLEGCRSTPALSFAVRRKQCSCGIMVTASHNPPCDNAVKVYWSTGGQLLPPHDAGVIGRVMQVDEIARLPFEEALSAGKIVKCQDEIDVAYIEAVHGQAIPGPRELRIVYSPLHGVGATAVCPALAADSFADVELFGPHATQDGDFPNVPHHVSNPENPEVFTAIIERARQVGADVVLASDPDCDRIGCAAPLRADGDAPWRTLTGNQIGALLAEFVLEARQRQEKLSEDHYVIKTLVTTELIRRIADSYGVRTCGDLLVGFKWIGGVMDAMGPDRFVFGTEESHGYLVGTYARDKDAAVAAMLLSELAARLKQQGETLHEKLDAIFWQYGAHAERTVSVAMPGSEGMRRIKTLMARLREAPPESLGGIEVARERDYLTQTVTPIGGTAEPLDGPKGDLVMLDLAKVGNYVAVRPSGTEPKVKFYMFGYEPPEQLADLESTKKELDQRLAAIEGDLRGFAEA